MDTYASVGATSGIISLVAMIGYMLYKLCAHSHCKSACCARPMFDLQVNLEEKDGDQTIIIPRKDLTAPLSPVKRQTGEPTV